MADVTEDVPYQSLYRRFRPSTFAEVRGQDHVVLALRNAVRDDRVAHAYLFSGPRGTGKTSTARILAKALNCTDLRDGEPCGVCSSCVEIAKGTSLDVHELDAASNNGVDAMRDLVSRAALGSPGRQKVYIVDEVHMLSTAASNALLKTLEEPPAHVVFVLATTDPQKVLPTIRSRTQHFEFRLLGPDTLSGLLAQVRDEAGLDVGDDALDLAVRRGRGSARDALSILDQVAASEAVDDDLPELDEVVEALAEGDVERALVAVAHLTAAGFSPQQLTVDLVDHLRQGFLALVAPDLVTVAGAERDALAAQAGRVGLATLVRAMEDLGAPRWRCATPRTRGSTSRWPSSAWSIPSPTTHRPPSSCASSASSRRAADPATGCRPRWVGVPRPVRHRRPGRRPPRAVAGLLRDPDPGRRAHPTGRTAVALPVRGPGTRPWSRPPSDARRPASPVGAARPGAPSPSADTPSPAGPPSPRPRRHLPTPIRRSGCRPAPPSPWPIPRRCPLRRPRTRRRPSPTATTWCGPGATT